MSMDIPLVETNFLLKPIETNKEENLFAGNKWRNIRDEERLDFHYDKLRPGQQEIYNYVHENPNNIVVVQGFPDSGKTFTLQAIAHSWEKPVNVIIYQNELLEDFQGIGNCRNKTKFFMDMFRMPFDTFTGFEDALIRTLNNAEFLLTIVNLIAKADIKQLHGSLVILDEYTVIPKPLLLVTLMLLKHYKIGAILCGDKCQLQNDKSFIMGSCTSYDIANVFADKSFWLRINETDSEYNKIVKYVRELVSEDWIDDFAQSLIAAVFPKQLLHDTQFTDTHLAGSHEELKVLADSLVSKEGHPCRPYEISTLDEEQMECSSTEKFLNYLPLVVGSSYYVDQRSEGMKGKLVRVEENKVVLSLNGVDITREPNNNDSFIYYKHKSELLGGKAGTIYNFPIYPANFMTVLKSQGRPVSGPLHIKFKSMSYRSMYVAVSRVKDVSQVVKVTIDDPISHLASCVINFGELVDPDFVITAALLKKRMVDYEYYYIYETSSIKHLLNNFFESESVEVRRKIRDKLISSVKDSSLKRLLNRPKVRGNWTSSPIHEILKYTDYWLGLACMKEEDRGIWLSEFLARTPALRSLTGPGIEHKNIDENNCFYTSAELSNLPEWGCNMADFISDQKKSINPTRFRKEIYDKYINGLAKEITTEWLVDSLNYTIREHRKGKGLLPKELKEEILVDQDMASVEHEDSDGQDESDGETNSTLETQNSMKEEVSSPMKRGNQEVEEDDDIEIKKKKKD